MGYSVRSNRPIPQIPKYTCGISRNASFRTEMFWMVCCGIWERCIVGFATFRCFAYSTCLLPVLTFSPLCVGVTVCLSPMLVNHLVTQMIKYKHACAYYSSHIVQFMRKKIQGFYSLRRYSLIGIGIPIINLGRSANRLLFIIGIPIHVKRCLLSE